MLRLLLFTCGLLMIGFIVFIISEYTTRRDAIKKNRLRSIVVTHNMSAPYFVSSSDLIKITELVNQKLLAPYGESDTWLNKPIHVKDIVSIAAIPGGTVDKIQVVVWYLHRYQDVVQPKAPSRYTNFNPYGNGWRQ